MIHYHGLPITPETAALRVVTGGHAFVSYFTQRQTDLVLSVAQSFAVDNGAFSAWRSGKAVQDWRGYYEWVDELRFFPTFDFAVIPDVIDGGEEENDALIAQWPWPATSIGAPVWHMHESVERLARLASQWPRVCIGSSAEFSTVGTPLWWARMKEALQALCDERGRVPCKLHGLRMLNPKIFSRLPLASADSTNIARNIGIDSAWRGTYLPQTKEARAQVMRERIESQQALTTWENGQ